MRPNLVATIRVQNSETNHQFRLNLSPSIWEEMDEAARRQYTAGRLAELVDIDVSVKETPVNIRVEANVVRGARYCCPHCGQQPLYEQMTEENATELDWEYNGELWPHRIHHGPSVYTSCTLNSLESYGRTQEEAAAGWLNLRNMQK